MQSKEKLQGKKEGEAKNINMKQSAKTNEVSNDNKGSISTMRKLLLDDLLR